MSDDGYVNVFYDAHTQLDTIRYLLSTAFTAVTVVILNIDNSNNNNSTHSMAR